MTISVPPLGQDLQKQKSSIWDKWTPVVYRFPWGPSLTRGCTFAWIFLTAPYYIAQHLMHKAAVATYVLCGSPTPEQCWYIVPMYVSIIPVAIIALIWIIVTVLLFFPWLALYLFVLLLECLVIIIFYITCCYCHRSRRRPDSQARPVYRIFSCSGWISEWREGFDPYTAEVWNQWSPVRTLCNYNFPPVSDV